MLSHVKVHNVYDLVSIFKESRHIGISPDELLANYQTGFYGDGFWGYFTYAANGTSVEFYGIFPSFVKL